MALNLNCRCSETKSSITATIYHHWTTLDREIEFHFVNGELLSYMLCVLWLRVCYLPFQGRYDIKFLVTEFWGIMENNHCFFKSYIDSILCSFELSLNWFSCLCSVKFALKDWRHWITSTTCRIRSVLLNKGMQ